MGVGQEHDLHRCNSVEKFYFILSKENQKSDIRFRFKMIVRIPFEFGCWLPKYPKTYTNTTCQTLVYVSRETFSKIPKMAYHPLILHFLSLCPNRTHIRTHYKSSTTSQNQTQTPPPAFQHSLHHRAGLVMSPATTSSELRPLFPFRFFLRISSTSVKKCPKWRKHTQPQCP